MTHVLDAHIKSFPSIEGQVHTIRDLYKDKLWYQLSEALLKYIEEPVLAQGESIINLYNGFVKEFESKVDPIRLVQIANAASEQFSSHDASVMFLRDLQSRLKDEQAILLAEIKIGSHHLVHKNLEGALNVIRDVTKRIEDIADPHVLIYSTFYNLCASYHNVKKNYEEFYKNSLQYLAYTPETHIKPERKVWISYEMAIAVLVSKTIYNYSELLEQPVFKALQGTEFEWVYHLIGAFNSGNIQQYEATKKKYGQNISQNTTLNENAKILDEKIKIMALLELIFSLPKNDRNIQFSKISGVTGLDLDLVELLIMRAMSLGLIKGTVDEIDQVVRINWVIPRVLDSTRIQIMKNKVEDWTQSLEVLIKQVEAENF